jgi:nicotinate-nucleotide adenylyltransferase
MQQIPIHGPRVAFFGGSFDPPHLGHLAIARAAQQALHLDAVLFAPVGTQPLKPLGSTASFEDRLAMTRLAIANQSSFELSLADAPKSTGQPNFTIDTLRHLRSQLPTNGALFCLMGADSLVNLKHWHHAALIPFVASLVVASRPGEPLDDLQSALPDGLSIEPSEADEEANPSVRKFALQNSAGESAPFYLLPELEVEISASQIRDALRAIDRAHLAASTLLADAVSNYICAHRLYL